jgi:hypothetical protein
LFVADLSVNNRIFVGLDVSINGNLSVKGTLYSKGVLLASDYRLKNIIKELDDKNIIDDIRVYEYLHKDFNDKNFGVIAHELQEIYPNLVEGIKDGKQMQSVNYIGIIPLLINEVKNLKKKLSYFENSNKKQDTIENFQNIDITNSSIYLNYNENNSSYFINDVSNNFTINYNNYPSNKSTIHTITLLIDNNYYGNAININGLSTRIKHDNSLFKLPIDSTFITQTISIINKSTNSEIDDYFAISSVKCFD